MRIENIEKKQFLELIHISSNEEYSEYSLIGQDNFFSGRDTVCISKKLLSEFINELINLKNKGDNVLLNDYDSDSFIKIVLRDNLGHYDIFFQIGGTHRDTYCKLKLNTDYIGIIKFKELLMY